MNVPWNVVATVMSIISAMLLGLGTYILNDIRTDISAQNEQLREDKAELTIKIDRAVDQLQTRVEVSANQSEDRQKESLDQLQQQLAQDKLDINGRLDRQSQEQRSTVQLIYTQTGEQLQRIARIEETIRRWEPLVVQESRD